MAIVVDFAWSKPTVAQLKQWGAVAVGMYISNDPTKNATPQLIDEYAAAGIKTFLFFEDAATNAQGGYSQGHTDAVFALGYATNVLKVPGWAPILPAVDYDVPDYAPNSASMLAKLGPVGDYLRAWNDVLGLTRTGLYGDYYVVQRGIGAGLTRLAVQTIAWSGGQVDLSQIGMYQNGGELDNGNVDIEQIESSALLNMIAWVPGETNPAKPPAPLPKPTPTPAGEQDMIIIVHIQGESAVYLWDGTSFSHITSVDNEAQFTDIGLKSVQVTPDQFAAMAGSGPYLTVPPGSAPVTPAK